MSKQYVFFEELPLKTEFTKNGTRYIKRSTRTAWLPDYNRWFYMGKKELCIVGAHSRLDKNYFEV